MFWLARSVATFLKKFTTKQILRVVCTSTRLTKYIDIIDKSQISVSSRDNQYVLHFDLYS